MYVHVYKRKGTKINFLLPPPLMKTVIATKKLRKGAETKCFYVWPVSLFPWLVYSMDKGILGLSVQEWHTSQKLRGGGGGTVAFQNSFGDGRGSYWPWKEGQTMYSFFHFTIGRS
jgi:hypothetical protein